MKLLILASELLPVRGGISTYITEIIKNIPKHIEIHVLTPNPKNVNKALYSNNYNYKIKDIEILDRINIHYIGNTNSNIFSNLKFQLNCSRQVPSLIKRYKINIIHSDSTLPDLFLDPRSLKIPIITTIHTTISDEINYTKNSDNNFSDLNNSEKTMILSGFFLKYLENNYYNKKRHYITVSKWMKNCIINNFQKIKPEQIEVIYNGVNSATFNPIEKKHIKKYFPELNDIDKPKILFLSRWVERKGIKYLLESIPKIIKKTDVHFIFAGPIKNANLKIQSKNYTFLGYVPQEKIPCLYASSDIFILPSLYENFPFTLLEAMSSELAIISTNVGGIPEMITNEENGVLIKSKSTEDIVKSIIYLSENNQIRKELGKRARIKVEKDFSWKEIAIKTKDYYKKVLENENIAC